MESLEDLIQDLENALKESK
nr:hypothetical protein [uncultured Clostridium sp.]